MVTDVRIEPALKPMVCLLGGTGFVGEHMAAWLSEQGYLVRVPTRRTERHRSLRVLPGVDLVTANVHDPDDLRRVLRGCYAAINLVGILNERRRGEFHDVHVRLPGRLAEACLDTGVERVLHMSALRAGDPAAKSAYHRTKGEGENLMHAVPGLKVTSFRPSLIFGPDDHLFNRFAGLLRKSVCVFPLACPEARFAPVYVGDVARAFHRALQLSDTIGQRYDLCGPRVYTLRELVAFTADTLGLERRIVGLGDGMSRLQAALMGWLPGRPFTRDNYLSLRAGGVCSGAFPPVFGITPTAVESVVPLYLGHINERARLDEGRRMAGRSPN